MMQRIHHRNQNQHHRQHHRHNVNRFCTLGKSEAFLHSNAALDDAVPMQYQPPDLPPAPTTTTRLLAERLRRRRSVAMFVQAHSFVLAEGDGPQPLCMVPRAQPLSQVLKMPRSLVLQPGLPAVPLVSRTSRGVLGQLVRACLRRASDSIEGQDPGSVYFLLLGTAEGRRSTATCASQGAAWFEDFQRC